MGSGKFSPSKFIYVKTINQ